MKKHEKSILLNTLHRGVQHKLQVMRGDTIYDLYMVGNQKAVVVKPFMSNLETFPITELKPIMRPISNMKPDEVKRLYDILSIDMDNSDWVKVNDLGFMVLYSENGKEYRDIAESMDYLDSIHVDYRGLIKSGIAIDITKKQSNKIGMEVAITKKLFLTVDIDIPEDEITQERLSEEIKKVIDEHDDLEDWDTADCTGKERYEAHETYGGTEIELNF